MNFCLENLQILFFYFKKTLKKKKKFINFTLCFKAPKMDKIVFYLDKGKINFVFHF